MLEEAARHVKLLQAQVGVLALMRAAGSSEVRKNWLATAAHALRCISQCRSMSQCVQVTSSLPRSFV